MADCAVCAVFVLWDFQRAQALMEDRPDLNPGTEHYWVYPGGKVEDGEQPVDAMRRECQEELGVAPLHFALLTADELRSYPRPGTRQYAKSPEGWRTIPFLVTAWQGTLPANTLDDNRAQLRWISPTEIAADPPSDYTCNVQIARLLSHTRGPFVLDERQDGQRFVIDQRDGHVFAALGRTDRGREYGLNLVREHNMQWRHRQRHAGEPNG